MLRPKRTSAHEERDVEDMSQDEPEKTTHKDDKHDQQAHDKTRNHHHRLPSMSEQLSRD
jgi:hypothetical protein